MKASKKLPKIKGAQFYKSSLKRFFHACPSQCWPSKRHFFKAGGRSERKKIPPVEPNLSVFDGCFQVGDKVETIRKDVGAWFAADIIDISPNSKCECVEECHCTYKLLFEGDDDTGELVIVERKLNEIRQVSYSSIDWDNLQVGMKVVINHNIDKPNQWGYWYDYVIEDLQKRDDVIYLKGTLLVGHEGISKKIPVKIDSDNVTDVLEIRPHATLKEKEMDGYETGVKPEYCKKCRNKPKIRCKTCCCCKCGNKKDFDLTVQCDECGDWYHIYCLEPPLPQLPDVEDWYCPNCSNETLRAKLEMKHKFKKQKRIEKVEKKSPVKSKRDQKPTATSPKPAKIVEPDLDEIEDIEMQEISKEIPKGSKVWKEVEKFYANYEILRVVAEVARKRDSDEVISSAVEEYIDKDVANEHLWEEAKQSVVKGKEAFLETVKRIFTCAICCELLNDPITLSCKHSFCIDCFFRSLSVNVYNCSLCRVDVIHTQHYVVNENLKKALAFLFGRKLSKKIDA